jgi:hypothetical protein
MPDCSQCDNTGYRDIVDAQGVHRALKCQHGRNGLGPAGGFTAIGDCRLAIDDLLTPPEKHIRDLILRRRGRENDN